MAKDDDTPAWKVISQEGKVMSLSEWVEEGAARIREAMEERKRARLAAMTPEQRAAYEAQERREAEKEARLRIRNQRRREKEIASAYRWLDAHWEECEAHFAEQVATWEAHERSLPEGSPERASVRRFIDDQRATRTAERAKTAERIRAWKAGKALGPPSE